MGVVFGLADKIAVVVYGEVIAFDTPEAVRANQRVQRPTSGRARSRQGDTDAENGQTCTPTTAKAMCCTA